MSEFKAIETQEALDAIIAERLSKQKNSIERKYEGWISPEDVEGKLSESNGKIEDLTKELAAANDKINAHDSELAEKNATIKKYETASMKAKIAHEAGLSYDAREFLKGETEEEIKESAEALKGLIGAGAAPPLGASEPPTGTKDAALRKTLRNLNKGGE